MIRIPVKIARLFSLWIVAIVQLDSFVCYFGLHFGFHTLLYLVKKLKRATKLITASLVDKVGKYLKDKTSFQVSKAKQPHALPESSDI